MKEYFVTFTYTVGVKAEDHEQAGDLGYKAFRSELLGGLGAGDFYMVEPEQVFLMGNEA